MTLNEGTRLTSVVALGLCVWPWRSFAQGGTDRVAGAEFAANANLPERNLPADGLIFVPQKVRPVR